MSGGTFDRDLRSVVHDYSEVEPPETLVNWLADLPTHRARTGRRLAIVTKALAAGIAVLLVSGLALSIYSVRGQTTAAPPGTPLSISVDPTSSANLCPDSALEPVRMERSGSEIIFISVATNVQVLITWPNGSTGWLVDGKAELLAPDGTVVATEGQAIAGLGGAGTGGRFHVCQINGHNYLP